MPHTQSSNPVVARSIRAGGAHHLIDMDEAPHLDLVRLLLARLERISADSYWAHRASGVRGSLIKLMEKLENKETVQRSEVDALISISLQILDAAARKKH